MCSDGLKGLKEAIGAVYPMTEFQRCIVHMIRNTLQYVSYKDRKELAQGLKQIYQAATEEAGYNNLIELDWSGDVDDEPSAGGCLGDCHGCHGCGSEDEDDDM